MCHEVVDRTRAFLSVWPVSLTRRTEERWREAQCEVRFPSVQGARREVEVEVEDGVE